MRSEMRAPNPALIVWRIFREYLENSNIHGVRYLVERRRPFVERFFWTFVLVLSVYSCTLLINKVYQKWDQSPVIVTFAEKPTPVWQIPFPAVTICPETKTKAKYLKYSKAYMSTLLNGPSQLPKKELTRLESISQICLSNVYKDIEFDQNLTDSSIVKNLRQMAPSLNETFVTCKWRNVELKSCDSLFTEVLTDEGICFTFNALEADEMLRKESIHTDYDYIMKSDISRKSTEWSLEDGYFGQNKDPYPSRVVGTGTRGGLIITLSLYEQDFDYICRGPVQGFKVLLHTPSEMPSPSKNYYRVPMNEEVGVSVRPNMVTTSETLINYAPNKRYCFFNKERYLRYFKIYTQRNCEIECLTNFTLTYCGCVKFSMPHDNTTAICGAGSYKCYNMAEDKLMEQEYHEGLSDVHTVKSCNCLPACTSIVYEGELSQANLNWKALYHVLYNETNAETLEARPGIQFSQLVVFFKEDQFIASARSELYGFIDVVASCGGLLGLFMGISMLSFVEILYYCIIRLICNLGMRCKKLP